MSHPQWHKTGHRAPVTKTEHNSTLCNRLAVCTYKAETHRLGRAVKHEPRSHCCRTQRATASDRPGDHRVGSSQARVGQQENARGCNSKTPNRSRCFTSAEPIARKSQSGRWSEGQKCANPTLHAIIQAYQPVNTGRQCLTKTEKLERRLRASNWFCRVSEAHIGQPYSAG